jgi:hypothetical protein
MATDPGAHDDEGVTMHDVLGQMELVAQETARSHASMARSIAAMTKHVQRLDADVRRLEALVDTLMAERDEQLLTRQCFVEQHALCPRPEACHCRCHGVAGDAQ